jgi:hypothetical protein
MHRFLHILQALIGWYLESMTHIFVNVSLALSSCDHGHLEFGKSCWKTICVLPATKSASSDCRLGKIADWVKHNGKDTCHWNVDLPQRISATPSSVDVQGHKFSTGDLASFILDVLRLLRRLRWAPSCNLFNLFAWLVHFVRT